MKIRTFKRYEKKYLLTDNNIEEFLDVVHKYMRPDEYCVNGEKYKINNIYYDDDQSSIIRHSISKPYYKEKLRLRGYSPFTDSDNTVFLEMKKKIGGIVSKRRATMTLAEAIRLMNFHEKPQNQKYIDSQVTDEILFFLKQHRVMPAAFISYERRAFFDSEDERFRLTVDSGIKARSSDFFLERSPSDISLLDDGLYIMEIKILGSIPLWLSELLSRLEIRKVTFSKYGRFYEAKKFSDTAKTENKKFSEPYILAMNKGENYYA